MSAFSVTPIINTLGFSIELSSDSKPSLLCAAQTFTGKSYQDEPYSGERPGHLHFISESSHFINFAIFLVNILHFCQLDNSSFVLITQRSSPTLSEITFNTEGDKLSLFDKINGTPGR